MPIPDCLPLVLVPLNGTLQKSKEKEYYLERVGADFKHNVRGTFDGSSPHTDESPNDFCFLDPELNKAWVSIRHVMWAASILQTVGSPISLFKTDFKASYQQLLMQYTQTARQFITWHWMDDDGVEEGGIFRDLRVEWGSKHAGAVFHRGITTLVVKYLTHLLVTKWAPNITCTITRHWYERRQQQGFSKTQCIPAWLAAFLDDTFYLVCGNDADVELAHAILMEGLAYLGFELSMSKFIEEGTPSQDGEVLGHGCDLQHGQRYITEHKRTRIRDLVEPLLRTNKWRRKDLERIIGLLQSVREDVISRWRLAPLYATLHGEGSGRFIPVPRYASADTRASWHGKREHVLPSEAAKRSFRTVLNTLHERRDIDIQPTPWPSPTAAICDGLPTYDASTRHGYGGVLKTGTTMEFFGAKWPEWVRTNDFIPIFLLEAMAVLIGAATWGHKFEGRKMLFRSDSSNTCSAFNKMKSDNKAMNLLIDFWEDLQRHFRFEGLIFFVPGRLNNCSDICSRSDDKDRLHDLRQELDGSGFHDTKLTEVVGQFTAGDIDLNVLQRLADMQHSTKLAK